MLKRKKYALGRSLLGSGGGGGKTESQREHSSLTLEMAFVSGQCSLRFLMGTSPWNSAGVLLLSLCICDLCLEGQTLWVEITQVSSGLMEKSLQKSFLFTLNSPAAEVSFVQNKSCHHSCAGI